MIGDDAILSCQSMAAQQSKLKWENDNQGCYLSGNLWDVGSWNSGFYINNDLQALSECLSQRHRLHLSTFLTIISTQSVRPSAIFTEKPVFVCQWLCSAMSIMAHNLKVSDPWTKEAGNKRPIRVKLNLDTVFAMTEKNWSVFAKYL